MKVVLFCGGLGTRLREHSGTLPKPLVPVGDRPIVWHLMRYYAMHGHREFILCLGYGGHHIRQFFLNYDARDAEDFVLDEGISRMTRSESDVPNWTVHFVDTGINANVGERLLAVRHLVEDDELFLANYSDGLSDLPLSDYIAWFAKQKAVASFVAVKPSQTFHLVEMQPSGRVTRMREVADTETWINGGFLVMTPEVFDFMRPGEELVEQPFERIISQGRLAAYRYEGFWKAMDTVKDKLSYDQMDARGERPWVWWR